MMNNVFSPTPCPLYHIFIPHLYTTWSLRNVIIKLLICCFVHLTFLQTSVYQVDPNLVVPNLSWIAITTVRNTCAIIQSLLRHHSVETYTHISYLHSQPGICSCSHIFWQGRSIAARSVKGTDEELVVCGEFRECLANWTMTQTESSLVADIWIFDVDTAVSDDLQVSVLLVENLKLDSTHFDEKIVVCP